MRLVVLVIAALFSLNAFAGSYYMLIPAEGGEAPVGTSGFKGITVTSSPTAPAEVTLTSGNCADASFAEGVSTGRQVYFIYDDKKLNDQLNVYYVGDVPPNGRKKTFSATAVGSCIESNVTYYKYIAGAGNMASEAAMNLCLDGKKCQDVYGNSFFEVAGKKKDAAVVCSTGKECDCFMELEAADYCITAVDADEKVYTWRNTTAGQSEGHSNRDEAHWRGYCDDHCLCGGSTCYYQEDLENWGGCTKTGGGAAPAQKTTQCLAAAQAALPA